MANNKFYVKRTSVTTRTPNVSSSGNSSYIGAGEFGLNMADGILYTSNGSALITVGANNVDVNVSNTLTVLAIKANGSIGTATQVLSSNGTGLYWAAAGAGGGSNTSILAARVYESFTATDGQTVFTVSGGYTNGAVDVFYNGVHLANNEYTQDGSSVTLTAGANVGAIVEVSGFKTALSASSGNTYVIFNDSGAAGANANFTFDKTTSTLTVGNSSVNAVISSGIMTLTSNLVANVVVANNKIHVGLGTGFPFGGTALIEGAGNANSFNEFNVQNSNNGTAASSDLVATADTGNDSVNFIDLGINSSTYNQAGFNIVGSLDGYLYTSNGHLAIGTASNKELIFHAGGTTSTNRIMTVNSTGIIISNSASLFANGSSGTAGQVLTSSGSGNVHWANASSGGTTLGLVVATAMGFNLP